MALYIPLSRRRRHAAIIAVLTLLAGLVVGFVSGRSSAVTASERAAAIRSRGDALGSRLEALTIEYEQVVSGTSDTLQGSVLASLDLLDHDLSGVIADAPWLGTSQITSLHAAVTAVRTAATNRVTAEAFTAVVDGSAKQLRATLGVDH